MQEEIRLKFIFCADSHLRATTPACRKDSDFYQVQFDKLRQIEQIAFARGVTHILHGGDLFDAHNPPLQLVFDLINELNVHTATWVVNPGNHDVFGETTETLGRSGLGVVAAAGFIEVVEKPTDKVFGNTIVRFIPRTKPVDMTLFMFDKIEVGKVYDIVPHMMLVPRSVPYSHFLISDVKTNADLVLCSDYHGWFNEKQGHTRFLNSGSLTRQSVTEKDAKPGVWFVDTDQTKVEFIELKVRPASEVISLDVEEKIEKSVAGDFLTTLKSTVFESVDRRQLVKEIGEKLGCSTAVIEAAAVRVKEAEASLI